MDETCYKALAMNSFTCITSVCTRFHCPALSQKTDNNIYHWYHPLQTSVEKLQNTFFLASVLYGIAPFLQNISKLLYTEHLQVNRKRY